MSEDPNATPVRAMPGAVMLGTLLGVPPGPAAGVLQQAQVLSRHRDGGLAILGVRRVEQISAFVRFPSAAERISRDAFR